MRGDEDRVGVHAAPAREQDCVGFQRRDGLVLVQRDRALGEDAAERGADRRVVGRQDRRSGHQQE